MCACKDVPQSKDCPKSSVSLYQRKWGLIFPLIGFLAFLWFLVRVMPKPSRATYPCQKVAMPLAFSFMAWVGGLTVTFLAAQGAKNFFRKSRRVLAVGCFLAGMLGAYVALESTVHDMLTAWSQAPAYEPALPPNTPIGSARGIKPGRVVWAYDPAVAIWDSNTGYYWQNGVDQQVLANMISNTVRSLSGKRTDAAAWDSIFKHFNERRGAGTTGYQAGQKIVVKINLNTSSNVNWATGDMRFNVNNTPQMVVELVRHLVNHAGVPAADITFFDASRIVGDCIVDLCHAEFPGVNFVDRPGTGVRIAAQPDMNTPVHFARPDEVDFSGETYLPTCVVEARYMINLSLLKGHDMAGVTFGAKNHFGSVWHNGSWNPGNMHDTVHVTGRFGSPIRPMGTYNSLVEMMGHEHLDGKGLIYIIEGFYATARQSGTPKRWLSAPFNNGWTASIFASLDPVALESVALDFVRAEAAEAGSEMQYNTLGAIDNFLHEAALAHNPPSGAFYDPEGNGIRLQSLGVHEVWNNNTDRQYSRNLGTGDGIELVQVSGTIIHESWINEFTITGADSLHAAYTRTGELTVYIDAEPSTEGEEITGWLLTQDAQFQPDEQTLWLETPPASHQITGATGPVTLHAWVIDDAGYTGRASASILLEPLQPQVLSYSVSDDGAGTITVDWTTDRLAFGAVEHKQAETEDLWSIAEGSLGTEHSVSFTASTEFTNFIIITNNGWPSQPIYYPTPWRIAGDVADDCKVNIADLIFVRNALMSNVYEGQNYRADVNGDGQVDLTDLVFVRNRIGSVCE